MAAGPLFARILFILVISVSSALASDPGSPDIEQRADAIIGNARRIAEGFKLYYKRRNTIPSGLDTLINDGILKSWPEPTHPSSDFYNNMNPLDDGGGAKYFVRYSFGEKEAEEICKKINEKMMGLAAGAAVSETKTKIVEGLIMFDPPPVETVNEPAFCLKIGDHYEYFHLIMPKPDLR